MLATAWNILGGYAGYVNFGTPAFFGIGAYTAVVLFQARAPLGADRRRGACMGALLGFGVGLLTLRLRGIFFAIATVAVIFIMETLMINWRYVGGAHRLQLVRPEVIAPFSAYAHAVRGHGGDGDRRDHHRALHPGFLDRARPARDARQRGGGRGERRADTAPLKLLACTVWAR